MENYIVDIGLAIAALLNVALTVRLSRRVPPRIPPPAYYPYDPVPVVRVPARRAFLNHEHVMEERSREMTNGALFAVLRCADRLCRYTERQELPRA